MHKIKKIATVLIIAIMMITTAISVSAEEPRVSWTETVASDATYFVSSYKGASARISVYAVNERYYIGITNVNAYPISFYGRGFFTADFIGGLIADRTKAIVVTEPFIAPNDTTFVCTESKGKSPDIGIGGSVGQVIAWNYARMAKVNERSATGVSWEKGLNIDERDGTVYVDYRISCNVPRAFVNSVTVFVIKDNSIIAAGTDKILKSGSDMTGSIDLEISDIPSYDSIEIYADPYVIPHESDSFTRLEKCMDRDYWTERVGENFENIRCCDRSGFIVLACVDDRARIFTWDSDTGEYTGSTASVYSDNYFNEEWWSSVIEDYSRHEFISEVSSSYDISHTMVRVYDKHNGSRIYCWNEAMKFYYPEEESGVLSDIKLPASFHDVPWNRLWVKDDILISFFISKPPLDYLYTDGGIWGLGFTNLNDEDISLDFKGGVQLFREHGSSGGISMYMENIAPGNTAVRVLGGISSSVPAPDTMIWEKFDVTDSKKKSVSWTSDTSLTTKDENTFIDYEISCERNAINAREGIVVFCVEGETVSDGTKNEWYDDEWYDIGYKMSMGGELNFYSGEKIRGSIDMGIIEAPEKVILFANPVECDYKTIPIPEANKALTYNGSVQTGVPAGEGYTVTGNTARDAGDYTAHIKASPGYVFYNNDTIKDEMDIYWSIKRATINVPVPVMGLIYNGSEQRGIKEDTSYVLGGTYKATDAGDYDVTVTPAENYEWGDKTTAAKTLGWSINRAKGTIDEIPDQDTDGAVIAIPITYTGDGALLAEANDKSIVSVTLNKNVLTLRPLSVGTSVITVSQKASKNYTACSVSFRYTVREKEIPVSYTIAFDNKYAETVVGDEVILTIRSIPSNIKHSSVTWDISDTQNLRVLSSDDNLIRVEPLRIGITEITATDEDGHTDTCIVRGYINVPRGTMVNMSEDHAIYKTGKDYYCFDKNKKVEAGFININGLTYYFDPDTGKAVSGVCSIDGYIYHFDKNCVMSSDCMTRIDGKWHHFGEDGRLSGGSFLLCSGKRGYSWYHFDENGILDSGVFRTTVDGYEDLFCFKNGKLFMPSKDGIYKINGNKYLICDGSVQTGRWEIKKKIYFFDEDTGAMRTGPVEEEGNRYLYGANGALKSGKYRIFTVSKKKYLVDEDGEIQGKGSVTVVDRSGHPVTYILDTDGSFLCGTIRYNNKLYLYRDGIQMTGYGWRKSGDKKYLLMNSIVYTGSYVDEKGNEYMLKEDGSMAQNEIISANKLNWFYNGAGKHVTRNMTKNGWYKVRNKYAYINYDNTAATGYASVNYILYWFDPKTGLTDKKALNEIKTK